MGYMKEKYTKQYFLNQDDNGNKTKYGVSGIEEFYKGDIRKADKDILQQLDLKDKNILTIGFGRGEDIKYCVEHGCIYICGVDFSQDACDIAEQYLNKYNINKDKYSIVCGDILDILDDGIWDIKYSNGLTEVIWYDIVLMFDVIEHIPRNEVRIILQQLEHFTKKDHLLCINTPFYNVDNDVIAEECINRKAVDSSDLYIQTQGMHCNRYSKFSLKKFLLYYNYKNIYDCKIFRKQGD
jgi:2-polyprenyl-3-methyl-5-hydroxy-6-metoxy-1,4-benzoquinol methylase